MNDAAAEPSALETPASVAQWSELIRDWKIDGPDSARLIPIGRRTKPSLATAGNSIAVSTKTLTGIQQYDPSEFTITVASGTPIADINAALAEHGQCLPFDPPRAGQGATIGGCVASGWSGPGRWRYGGIRDFILAASFLDGLGNEVHTGAAVVKNAAGFDFPKLMVGSLGRLGVLTSLTFKVFPKSIDPVTVSIPCDGLDAAIDAMQQLTRMPIEIDAIELCPPDVIYVRVPGPGDVASDLVGRIQARWPCDAMTNEDADSFWLRVRDQEAAATIRVPITPLRLESLHESFERSVLRERWQLHFGLAGNVMFVTGDGNWIDVQTWLTEMAVPGLLIQSKDEGLKACHVGKWRRDPIADRVAHAIDPRGVFAPLMPNEVT